MIKISNKGETIVEVLISIAVVGGVLAGSYYLLNRSYRQTQDSVERTVATKIGESNIEMLRTVQKVKLEAPAYNPFCLSSTAVLLPTTDTSCKIDDKYNVSISKNSTSTYLIKVEWDGLIYAKEDLTLYYRP